MKNDLTPFSKTPQAIESFQKGLKLKVRDSDIIIVTYPKSGTTWMQQIVYQMVSGGNESFDEISAVVPWIERAHFLKQDLEAMPAPRVLKTHFSYKEIPKGPGKYIFVMRDGKDVAVSFYQFLIAIGNRQDVSFQEFFVDQFLTGATVGGNWFTYIKDWWKHRKDSNVLTITYEDMKERPHPEVDIDRISEFCGFNLSPDLRRLVVEHSSFDYMKKHEKQFDDHFLFKAIEASGIGNKRHVASKVREGKVGRAAQFFTPELHELFDEEFRKHMAELGVKNYQDFRQVLNSESSSAT